MPYRARLSVSRLGAAGERNLAGQVARKVNGVASVDNQIKIVKGS